MTASPGDPQQLVAAVSTLLDDPAASHRAGAKGRAYAEKAFDIRIKADQFEAVLRDCGACI